MLLLGGIVGVVDDDGDGDDDDGDFTYLIISMS
jgi:hypothetical protein